MLFAGFTHFYWLIKDIHTANRRSAQPEGSVRRDSFDLIRPAFAGHLPLRRIVK